VVMNVLNRKENMIVNNVTRIVENDYILCSVTNRFLFVQISIRLVQWDDVLKANRKYIKLKKMQTMVVCYERERERERSSVKEKFEMN